ncbi:MAG: HAMP domain-containing sensor histidine kinase [Verrucomicrobiota bacterium]
MHTFNGDSLLELGSFLVTLDHKFLISYWDYNAEEFSGVMASEIVGKSLLEERRLYNGFALRPEDFTRSHATGFSVVSPRPISGGDIRYSKYANAVIVYNSSNKETSYTVFIRLLSRISGDLYFRYDDLQVSNAVTAHAVHRLNNHLMGIMTTAGFLEVGSRDSLSEKQLNLLGSIQTYCEAAASELDRIDRGPHPGRTRYETTDLKDLLNEVNQVTQARLPPQTSLGMYLPDGELRVQGERRLIKRALYALIFNAIEACSSECNSIEIEAVKGGDDHIALLYIRDDGTGLPSIQKNRLFEPYVTTKADLGRLGFGLPKASAIMKYFGGDLFLSRLPEGGTQAAMLFTRS